MDMVKHSQSTRNNKFAIPSQYFKKEVRDGVPFLHANKHQTFYKLAISFLMEVARHVQSTQKRKLVTFLQYIKKKLLQLFLCSIVIKKHLNILHRSSHVCYLCCFCLLWLAMKFKSFTVLINSKYIKQTDQNNFSCFFILILIKTKANKAAIFVF